MKKLFFIYKKYEEIINYLVIGILTTIVSLLTYYLCVVTFLNPKVAIELQIANIISWVISVAFAYITNRIFVFKSKSKKILNEIWKFVSSRIVTLLLDMIMMYLLVTCISFNDKISKILVQVVIIVLNYAFSKLFVFNKNK